MLHVAPDWVIPSEDLQLQSVRSSGPGGQNVNKVSSKVELRFALGATQALSPAQKRRLAAAFPSHVTRAGDFLISGDRFRSRLQNERDVYERLAQMLLSVRRAPPRRVPTRPSRAAKQRRLTAKRARGDTKRERRARGDS
ncbi:MAG TPA: alternative ribosome rescue aminoacyl-tRNA hydrolase ArfB [Polyangiaceae bacterium]|jgi:ribosome-associated protein|nr:alternative ribosome rescue aminoacyl-tRNA hydrolase ArfB [Polyangiaceae bacterium]